MSTVRGAPIVAGLTLRSTYKFGSLGQTSPSEDYGVIAWEVATFSWVVASLEYAHAANWPGHASYDPAG